MAGNKLSKSATDLRIDKCYELRYQSENAIKHDEWQTYCHKHYGDKSEITYTKYWTEAGNRYKNAWRELLSEQLTPAVNELVNLLQDDNPSIRQKAIDQIFKYTGNDVQKIEHKVEGEINLSWGGEEKEDE
jgi:hypothetical protein